MISPGMRAIARYDAFNRCLPRKYLLVVYRYRLAFMAAAIDLCYRANYGSRRQHFLIPDKMTCAVLRRWATAVTLDGHWLADAAPADFTLASPNDDHTEPYNED